MADGRYTFVVGVRDQATKQLDGISNRVSAVGKVVGRAFAVYGTAAATAIGAATIASIRHADEVAKTARIIGISTEELQAYSHAVVSAGGDTRQLTDSLIRMRRRAGEAANGGAELTQVFREVGVDVKNSAGQVKSSSQLFREVADGLKNLGDEQRAAGIAAKIFDDGWRSVIRIIGEGSAGLDNTVARAKILGLTLSTDLTEGAEEAADALDTLAAVWKNTSTSLFARGSDEIVTAATVFTNFAGRINAGAENIEKRGWLANISDRFKALGADIDAGILQAQGPIEGLYTLLTDQLDFKSFLNFGGAPSQEFADALAKAGDAAGDAAGNQTELALATAAASQKLQEQQRAWATYFSQLQVASASSQGDLIAQEAARVEQQKLVLDTRLETLRKFGTDEVELTELRTSAVEQIELASRNKIATAQKNALRNANSTLAALQADDAFSRIEVAADRELQAVDAKLLALRESGAAEVEIVRELEAQKQAIKDRAVKETAKTHVQEAQRFLSDLQGLLAISSQQNRKSFELQKVAALASAALAGAESISHAYNWGNRLGGPALGGSFAALAGIAVASQLRTINRQSFANASTSVTTSGSGASNASGNQPQQVGIDNRGSNNQQPIQIFLPNDGTDLFSAATIRTLADRIGEQTGSEISVVG